MKLAAVIVEDRQEVNLKQVISSHLRFLPADIDLFVYCPISSLFVAGQSAKVKYISICEKINNHTYNKLLTSVSFWQRLIGYDRVLIFQSDSGLLKDGIEEFCRDGADYYGSPWKFQEHGGNGGLSLRNPKTMLLICKMYNGLYCKSKHGNEDVFFCNVMKNENIGRLGSREMNTKFACESIYSLNTFGYHAIDRYFSKEEVLQIKEQYL